MNGKEELVKLKYCVPMVRSVLCAGERGLGLVFLVL